MSLFQGSSLEDEFLFYNWFLFLKSFPLQNCMYQQFRWKLSIFLLRIIFPTDHKTLTSHWFLFCASVDSLLLTLPRLQVTDFSICAISPEKLAVPSSQLEAENGDLVTFLGDSDLLNQNAALDLTEPPPYIALPVVNDVIDLSGDTNFAFNALDPIDLSAPQPQRKDGGDRTMIVHGSEDVGGPGYTCAKSNHSFGTWDPEPDFSFTDLLTNDFDDPDTVFNCLLSNDLSMHSSPCKTSIPIVSHALTNPTNINTNTQPPPLDLRLPHAAMFSF